MEEEIAECEKRWAKPFKYRQTIVLYSILIVIAFAMPFLGGGIYIYKLIGGCSFAFYYVVL